MMAVLIWHTAMAQPDDYLSEPTQELSMLAAGAKESIQKKSAAMRERRDES